MSNTITFTTYSKEINVHNTLPLSEQAKARFDKLYLSEDRVGGTLFIDILKDLGLTFGGDTGVLDEVGEYLANNPEAAFDITYDEDGIVTEMKIIPPPNATEEQIAEADSINEKLASVITDVKYSAGVTASFSVRVNQDFNLQLTFQGRANEEAEGTEEKKTTVVRVSKSSDENDKQIPSDGTWVISSTTSNAEGAKTSANPVAVVEPSAV